MEGSMRRFWWLWDSGLKRLLIFAVLGPLIYGVPLFVFFSVVGFPDGRSDYLRIFCILCLVGVPQLLPAAGLDALLRKMPRRAKMFWMICLGYSLSFIVEMDKLAHSPEEITVLVASGLVPLYSFYDLIPIVVCAWLSSGKQYRGAVPISAEKTEAARKHHSAFGARSAFNSLNVLLQKSSIVAIPTLLIFYTSWSDGEVFFSGSLKIGSIICIGVLVGFGPLMLSELISRISGSRSVRMFSLMALASFGDIAAWSFYGWDLEYSEPSVLLAIGWFSITGFVPALVCLWLSIGTQSEATQWTSPRMKRLQSWTLRLGICRVSMICIRVVTLVVAILIVLFTIPSEYRPPIPRWLLSLVDMPWILDRPSAWPELMMILVLTLNGAAYVAGLWLPSGTPTQQADPA